MLVPEGECVQAVFGHHVQERRPELEVLHGFRITFFGFMIVSPVGIPGQIEFYGPEREAGVNQFFGNCGYSFAGCIIPNFYESIHQACLINGLHLHLAAIFYYAKPFFLYSRISTWVDKGSRYMLSTRSRRFVYHHGLQV